VTKIVRGREVLAIQSELVYPKYFGYQPNFIRTFSDRNKFAAHCRHRKENSKEAVLFFLKKDIGAELSKLMENFIYACWNY
jgi:hypothetical protein